MVRMHKLHPEIRREQWLLNHLLQRRHAYRDSIEPGARPVRRHAYQDIRVAALTPSTFLNGYRFYEARRNGFGVAEASRVVLVHHNWVRGDIEKWRRAREFHALAINDTEPAARFLGRARVAMRHKSSKLPYRCSQSPFETCNGQWQCKRTCGGAPGLAVVFNV